MAWNRAGLHAVTHRLTISFIFLGIDTVYIPSEPKTYLFVFFLETLFFLQNLRKPLVSCQNPGVSKKTYALEPVINPYKTRN